MDTVIGNSQKHEEHKAQFIENMKKESQENIFKNELHLMKLNDELGILRNEQARLNLDLENKGKPAAAAEKKQQLALEQNIAAKQKEIAQVEETKKYNEYLLNDLLPRYANLNN